MEVVSLEVNISCFQYFFSALFCLNAFRIKENCIALLFGITGDSVFIKTINYVRLQQVATEIRQFFTTEKKIPFLIEKF